MTQNISGTKPAHDWHTTCLIKGFEAPFDTRYDTWNDSQLTYTYLCLPYPNWPWYSSATGIKLILSKVNVAA